MRHPSSAVQKRATVSLGEKQLIKQRSRDQARHGTQKGSLVEKNFFGNGMDESCTPQTCDR